MRKNTRLGERQEQALARQVKHDKLTLEQKYEKAKKRNPQGKEAKRLRKELAKRKR